jgi:hypothetical protein
VALVAAVVCAALALRPSLAVGRKDESPRAGSIHAGHTIKAGGDIQAAGDVRAGRDIDAGGGIQAGGPDRLRLLRERYREGRSLQRRLVWAGGIPETPEQAREAEDQARYEACKWGQSTWRVIAAHFPGYEQDFFGDGPLALGSTGFALACQQEIERSDGSADSYLERKLTMIAALLKKYD